MNADHEPSVEVRMDETDVNLCAYLEGLSAEHLAKYRPEWTDEEVVEWDGNFRSDARLLRARCGNRRISKGIGKTHSFWQLVFVGLDSQNTSPSFPLFRWCFHLCFQEFNKSLCVLPAVKNISAMARPIYDMKFNRQTSVFISFLDSL